MDIITMAVSEHCSLADYGAMTPLYVHVTDQVSL